MKKTILSILLTFFIQSIVLGDVEDDLKLYLSHKYISRILETSKPNISCLTPPGKAREQYEHEKEMENLDSKNKLRSLLEQENSEAAIEFTTKSMEELSKAFKADLTPPISDTIRITETEELLKDLGQRGQIKNNNYFIASRYLSDFLNGRINNPEITKLLYYSDIIQNGGYVHSIISEI